MQTAVDPVEAARAVATYFPADPAVWLERAALAGIEVSMEGGRLCFIELLVTDHDEATFLSCWLNLTPGGRDAVRKLLTRRRVAH
jgi:hypothetical protein